MRHLLLLAGRIHTAVGSRTGARRPSSTCFRVVHALRADLGARRTRWKEVLARRRTWIFRSCSATRFEVLKEPGPPEAGGDDPGKPPLAAAVCAFASLPGPLAGFGKQSRDRCHGRACQCGVTLNSATLEQNWSQSFRDRRFSAYPTASTANPATLRVYPIVHIGYTRSGDNPRNSAHAGICRSPAAAMPTGASISRMVAEIGLRVLGMENAEARRFAQSAGLAVHHAPLIRATIPVGSGEAVRSGRDRDVRVRFTRRYTSSRSTGHNKERARRKSASVQSFGTTPRATHPLVFQNWQTVSVFALSGATYLRGAVRDRAKRAVSSVSWMTDTVIRDPRSASQAFAWIERRGRRSCRSPHPCRRGEGVRLPWSPTVPARRRRSRCCWASSLRRAGQRHAAGRAASAITEGAREGRFSSRAFPLPRFADGARAAARSRPPLRFAGRSISNASHRRAAGARELCGKRRIVRSGSSARA